MNEFEITSDDGVRLRIRDTADDEDKMRHMLDLLRILLESTFIDERCDPTTWTGDTPLLLRTKREKRPIDLRSFLEYAKAEGIELKFFPMQIMGQTLWQVNWVLGDITVDMPEGAE